MVGKLEFFVIAVRITILEAIELVVEKRCVVINVEVPVHAYNVFFVFLGAVAA